MLTLIGKSVGHGSNFRIADHAATFAGREVLRDLPHPEAELMGVLKEGADEPG